MRFHATCWGQLGVADGDHKLKGQSPGWRSIRAILTNGTPQKMALSFDGDSNFIQIPFATKTRRMALNFVGIVSSEFRCPLSHCRKSEDDTTICQLVFDNE